MKTNLLTLILVSLSLGLIAQTVTLTNTSVQPRSDGSGLVDVYFDLGGENESYNILIDVSFDAGDTYTPISGAYLSGDLQGVSPSSKHVKWDGYGSFPRKYSIRTKNKI